MRTSASRLVVAGLAAALVGSTALAQTSPGAAPSAPATPKLLDGPIVVPPPVAIPPGPPPVAVPETPKPGPAFVPQAPVLVPAPPAKPVEAPKVEAKPAPSEGEAKAPTAAPGGDVKPAPAPGSEVKPTPAAPGAEAKPAEPAKPLVEEVELPARTVLFVTGVTTWEKAEDKMAAVFETLSKAATKLGIGEHGAPIVEYIESDSDDVGFKAMLPIPVEPKGKLPKGVKVGQSPSGKAFKFRHDGPIDDLEEVYSRIDDEMAKRNIDAKSILEEYAPDALDSPEDAIVADVYVLVK